MPLSGQNVVVTTSLVLFTCDRFVNRTPTAPTAGTYTVGGIADGPPIRGLELTVTGGPANVYVLGRGDRAEAITGQLPAGVPLLHRICEPDSVAAGRTVHLFGQALARGLISHALVVPADEESPTTTVSWIAMY